MLSTVKQPTTFEDNQNHPSAHHLNLVEPLPTFPELQSFPVQWSNPATTTMNENDLCDHCKQKLATEQVLSSSYTTSNHTSTINSATVTPVQDSNNINGSNNDVMLYLCDTCASEQRYSNTQKENKRIREKRKNDILFGIFALLFVAIVLFLMILWIDQIIHYIAILSASVPATCTVLRSDVFTVNPCTTYSSFTNTTTLNQHLEKPPRDKKMSEHLKGTDCRLLYFYHILVTVKGKEEDTEVWSNHDTGVSLMNIPYTGKTSLFSTDERYLSKKALLKEMNQCSVGSSFSCYYLRADEAPVPSSQNVPSQKGDKQDNMVLKKHPSTPTNLFDNSDESSSSSSSLSTRMMNPYDRKMNLTTTAFEKHVGEEELILLSLLPFIGLLGCLGIFAKGMR
jgi:hypothetical protein